ncbi:hypothetical protein PoB_005237300 [Plakobranchus ocellatus]|uniref:NAD(P)H oxidase (H2O2-forming) n=1 Tax=Plakobranchus ocellatus TaxID=259542 RepID=A0AAV4C1T2_9GAST|nr:hypothetical protein PoB_005237300 [Plakobranchus ocellatus]
MLGCILGYLLIFAQCTHVANEEFERHPNDGWYNNLVHPDWGAIDTHLLRLSRSAYSDGVYEPSGRNRPNPFTISQIAFKGNNTLSSLRKRNALLAFFGQQLVEEIMDAQRPGCPIEFFNIPVPKDHKYNPDGKDNLEMPFRRARYDQTTGHSPNNPRQQLNEITPFIDGNIVYGPGKAVEDAIRSFQGGLLKASSKKLKESFPVENDIRLPFANPPSPRDHKLRPVSRFRMFGNPRTHENPFLVALSTVWFRYHNFIAATLKRRDPRLDDEALFLAAKKRVIGQYQKIVMYEWLPAFLEIRWQNLQPTFNMADYPYRGGGKNIYKGYSPNVHPGISTEFQAAAMRYGHTLVPAGVKTKRIRDGSCFNSERPIKAKHSTKANGYDDGDEKLNVTGIRLCNSYWVSEETVEEPDGIDEIIRGMVFTLSAAEDNVIVSDLRENVFGPLDWSRRDLGALNIQRGRDMGLPGYNDVREAYGLPRKEKWEDISPRFSVIIQELKAIYNNTEAPDDLDLFPGGLLETTYSGPGELFTAIILDQFLRIRHGDRFWYENTDNGLYSPEEIEAIDSTTFFDVLNSVTGFYDRFVMRKIDRKNIFMCQKTTGSDCGCENPDFGEEEVEPFPNNQTAAAEACVSIKRYDYFSGSEGSFVATVLVTILALPITVGIMYLMVWLRHNEVDFHKLPAQAHPQAGPNEFYATEWVGRTAYGLLNHRPVMIILDGQRLKIKVATLQGQVARMLDLRGRLNGAGKKPEATVTKSCDKGYKMMLLAVPGEIDLVLHFSTMHERDVAFDRVREFFETHNWEIYEACPKVESALWKDAQTIDLRKQVLAKFFQRIVSDLSGQTDGQDVSKLSQLEQEALNTKLTRTEFADALGLQPHSLFVRNMFLLVDSTGDGFVSFEDFKAYFGILYSGNADKKAEMFFKMFDTSRSGKLSKENYKKMIKSLVELNDNEGSNSVDVNSIVNRIFQQMGREKQGYLTMTEFKAIMFSDTADLWQSATLNLDVNPDAPKVLIKSGSVRHRAQTLAARYSKRTRVRRMQSLVMVPQVEILAQSSTPPTTRYGLLLQKWARYVDNHSRSIFWLTLYTLVTAGIFIERAYYYSLERENGGLRRLAGYGVSVTRGAASAQMFTFASLLLTMCRNSVTFWRETFLNRFIPFDNMHDMHIYISGLAMFFTVMHVVGHLVNFYHISTQASLDLNCYFREYFRASHVLASFQYWTYETITGLTGAILVVVIVVMYVFAMPYARRNLFKYFSKTHSLYVVLYILLFMHGSARLVQDPLWGNFCVGPVVLFLMDKLVSISRNKVLLHVHKAKLLPSGVTNLVIKRPLSFDYYSGQWVRIACPALGKGEYHPFTLTSSPHEDCLSLHIRAVGPWTKNLRQLFESNAAGKLGYPKIYVDGPFGESHQDWYKFPVSVLIGAGIGITPFASILKDIAHRAKNLSRVPCQKVYFLWVTRTQRSFEWMTEIIRQVEATDNKGFVDVQICITQLREKFDLRTTMLYICERHFQKIAGLSMFTGLRAKTHFGRPKFADFFEALKMVHHDVRQIGVFSCGPSALTRSVNLACIEHNAYTGPSLIHHYENF